MLQLRLPGLDFEESPGRTRKVPDSLAAAVAWFLQERPRRGRPLSPHTRRVWREDLELLLAFLGPARKLQGISSKDLAAFLVHLSQRRSPRSVQRTQMTLRTFFRFLAETWGFPDPAGELPPVEVELPPYPALSPEEMERLYRAAMEQLAAGDPRPLVAVGLLEAGLKPEEILELRWTDLDPPGPNATRVLVQARTARHRRAVRWVSLPEMLRQALAALQDPRLYRDRRVRRRAAQGRVWAWSGTRMRRLIQGLGFPGLDPNQIRWTAAVRDLARGMDPEVVRGRLGISAKEWARRLPRLQPALERWRGA